MSFSLSAKVALVLTFVGAVVFLIGFSTNYWTDDIVFSVPYVDPYTRRRTTTLMYQNFGLWKNCVEIPNKRTSSCADWLNRDRGALGGFTDLPDELRATQFFETVGLLLLIPAVLLLILGNLLEACKDRSILPILSGVCLLGAGGCVLLGSIIFGTWSPMDNYLSWSFALAIVGGVFFGLAGLVVIVGAIKKN